LFRSPFLFNFFCLDAKETKDQGYGKKAGSPSLARENEKVAGDWKSFFNYLHTKHTFSLLPALKNALLVCLFSECRFRVDVTILKIFRKVNPSLDLQHAVREPGDCRAEQFGNRDSFGYFSSKEK
jgi:hypothetical protein